MLEKTYAEAGGKLRAGRSQLERAQRDMGRAGQQRQMAEQQAEAARRAAGLSTTTSGLNVALKAMQDAAARDLANAEAANMKAKLLKPTRPEQDDPNIAACNADRLRQAGGADQPDRPAGSAARALIERPPARRGRQRLSRADSYQTPYAMTAASCRPLRRGRA